MPQFTSFVIFAGMRTGSNLLEATLNANGLACLGEAFNPYILGWPGHEEMYGMTLADRDADPLALWQRIVQSRGARKIRGFRYFHDHDPRLFDPLMDDPTCAKIVLTRNPVDSWVSTQLAYATDQWKLNETETPIPAAAHLSRNRTKVSASKKNCVIPLDAPASTLRFSQATSAAVPGLSGCGSG